MFSKNRAPDLLISCGETLLSSRMVNIGLIGAGNISDTHARAAVAIPGVTIAAVYAPTLEHAQRLAARHGAVAYDTLDGLLSHRPLDIVAIGSPSGLHAEQGIAAAKRDCTSSSRSRSTSRRLGRTP